MAKITLKTADRVVPMIYAYTTPGISSHDGYIITPAIKIFLTA